MMGPVGEGWAPGVAPVSVAPRASRMRWTFAAAVVICVTVATAAGAFVLSGAAGSKSLTAGVAPRNAMFFMEVRTDLPGDQHTKLAGFMSHFPGFQDRSQFDYALDQMLSRLTGAISPELSYSSAFKPWMEGEVSVTVTAPTASIPSGLSGCDDLSRLGTNMPSPPVDPNLDMFYSMYPALRSFDPAVLSDPDFTFDPALFGVDPDFTFDPYDLASLNAALSPETLSGLVPEAVAIFALKDRAAAETWVTGEMARMNAKATSQDYAGFKLYTTGSGYSQAAYAFTSQDLVIGTVGGVKASLDTKTRGSLADVAGYQAAMKSVSGESIARFYLDTSYYTRTYTDTLNELSCLLESAGTKAAPTFNLSAMPAWMAGSIRAESDRMVVEMAMPGAGQQHPGNHASVLASSLPGNTVGVYEVHSIGESVNAGLDSLSSLGSLPGMGSSVTDIKDLVDRFGGVAWLGDGAAVITKTGDSFGGGVVVQTADAATARTKVDMLTNLVALSGGVIKTTSRDETYKGLGITVVTIPASSGMPAVEIAIGAKENLIVAGYTDAFVKAVIDTTPSDSLASQEDYSAAIGASGSSNMGSMYVNVPALEDLIGRAAMSENQSRWTQDYKPYFDHIGGVAYSAVDGNTVIMRLVVMAK
jgi:hypothetical protein